MALESIAEVNEAVKRFPAPEGGVVTALDNISLKIQQGQFVDPAGTFRLWKNHSPQSDQRIRRPRLGRGTHRR